MTDVDMLRQLLAEFEELVIDKISIELRRIKRPVKIKELSGMPFQRAIAEYATTIRLNEGKDPVIETKFCFAENQYLTTFISDQVIGHRKMISLLSMLKQIEN